ncbi:MAG TPA: hypothetical protein VER17_18775 [Tepidisphaeraceae bacterium]|nr:hypothetical protein [Tepidisphaeraceae bacterium]
MLQQTFDPHDLAVVGLLVVLEGVLSIDNALVLGLLAKRLPKRMQARALTYGLVGAFVFRLIAIATASWLLHWRIVKLLGGGYLVFIAVKHLFFEAQEQKPEHVGVGPDNEPALIDDRTGEPIAPEDADVEIKERIPVPLPDDTRAAPADHPDTDAVARRKFWVTVGVIELTDIAFAIDSILAAIALVGSAPAGHAGTHPKLWVVLTGGMIGVVLMRYAAVIFIKMLERFPRFETAAYLLVIVIGGKLVIDWAANSAEHPHRVDFHSPSSPAFWTFWILMVACFCVGFIPKRTARG